MLDIVVEYDLVAPAPGQTHRTHHFKMGVETLGRGIGTKGTKTMNEAVKHLSHYRFKEQSSKHREPYWQSTVSFNGRRTSVVDAAGIDEDGRNVVRLLPYKENGECPQIDEILRDGDLLAYVQGPKEISIPSDVPNADSKVLEHIGNVLKGRATHAELGYRNAEQRAMQVSLWGRLGPMQAEDRRFSIHTNSDTISIYRVSLSGYGVDLRTETLLKSEIKRWKELVKPVYFPFGAEMNVDPVDFTTIDELRTIAEKLIAHSPNDKNPPLGFKLNCVQWSTLVFSLAVCFPLSGDMLRQIGRLNEYRENWADRLGFADEGLVGITELPFPFYTMEEIIENTLDLYLPEYKSALMSTLTNLPLQQILSKLGVAASKRVMPNAFVMENRLHGLGFERKTKSVFQYVATAAPERELQVVES